VVQYFNTLSQHDNYTGPTGTKFNFGPHRLIPCVKLLRIEAQIEVASPTQALTTGALALNPFIWGVQFGLEGYTPADLMTDAFAPNYLWTKLMGGNSAEHPAWGPSTSTGAMGLLASASWLWRGQMPVNQNTDLYVSVANNNTVPANIVAHCLLRVLSTALGADATRRAGAASRLHVHPNVHLTLTVWPVSQNSPSG
jgi:hypothetical protein